MDELVSVIITSYKRDIQYVKEAITSAMNQSFKNIEIIVVDDNGKNEEYSKPLEELCKSLNVRYIKNEKNSGAQFSRNVGILNASGMYVAFLDDDDIWREDKIEKQLALFTEPDIGMVYCDGVSFEDGNINHQWEFRDASIYDLPITNRIELFNDYIGSTSQVIIKKICFAKTGLFDIDMPARQDYEMWLRITKFYKVVGSPEKLLYYRVHSGERISTDWDKCFRSYQLVLKKHKHEFDTFRYAKAKIILRLFDTSIKMRRPIRAIKYFLYATLTNPKCVAHVIDRNMKKIAFRDYYSLSLLRKIGAIKD